jgi:hypothetical protein
MAVLTSNSWVYTPVKRLFHIDADTLLITSDGIRPISEFLGYTENSAISKVYNIAFDGAKALRLSDAPYARSSVRGTIYSLTPASISIKEASYFEPSTGVWKLTSSTDATAQVNIPKNALIAKNQTLTGPNSLEIGDQILVFTDKLPTVEAGIEVDGYVILAEK